MDLKHDIYEEEEEEEKIRYPYSVFFIVGNEFCERFSYYGMRTILSIYLVNELFYSKADATVLYHSFTMLAYFFPVLGAILSDSVLGKFRTIFYVSIVYAMGNVLLALASTDPLNLPQREISILALVLISIGTGGIKPCVSAFGGDQFQVPEQAADLVKFFSFFYFSINAGSLISTFLTPVLRENVHCFDNESCYPLAFGIPGILMIVSIVIFGLGKPLYKMKKPEGNIIVKVSKCITYAVKEKIKAKEKKTHWLDYAEEKFGKTLVNDVKATLKVLVLYTPLPIFWALYDQQGTSWTFQAVRMDGDLGFYTILPDQFQVVNPILILAFIPLFSYVVYPVLNKFGIIRTPLQRMACGVFLAAVAFAVSAVVSMAIEATDPVMPGDGFAHLRLYNPTSCKLNIVQGKATPCTLAQSISSMENVEITDFKVKNGSFAGKFDYEFEGVGCPPKGTATFSINEKDTKMLYFNDKGYIYIDDDVSKNEDTGLPIIRAIMSISNTTADISFKYTSGKYDIKVNNSFDERVEVNADKYESPSGEKLNVRLGGVYTIMLNMKSDGKTYHIADQTFVTVTEPNSVNMFWLLPQYIIITAAEILFSITGLEFSYSQAPMSMKSLLQAMFLLSDAFGNLIIVIIESAKIFDKASSDFFLYTVLMIADLLVFAYLANNYTYVKVEKSKKKAIEGETVDKDNNIIDRKSSGGLDNPVFTMNEET